MPLVYTVIWWSILSFSKLSVIGSMQAKIGICVLSGNGWICILFATLRVVQVGVYGIPSTPDPKWSQMWTVIKSSMAVIIGCAPAFTGLIRRRFGTPDVSYNSRGYVKRSTDDIKMKSLESDNTGKAKRRNQELWTDCYGSEEALADLGGLITVTTTRVQGDEMSARMSTATSTRPPKEV
ncbi:hypothetical protein E8E11_010361 [Didymella keratinophila]|nr:hypothetical protein E8E11_010361 [Didymella keratinophila]